MANKFREEDHPRAKDGKFTKKGSGESSNPKDLQKDVPDPGAQGNITESSDARQLQRDPLLKKYGMNDDIIAKQKAIDEQVKETKNPVKNKEAFDYADSIIEVSVEKDKTITPLIQGICQKFGGENFGIDFRIKSRESLARKISDKIEKKPQINFEELKQDIKDSLRFTSIAPTENFTEHVQYVVNELTSQGFTVTKQKNNFTSPGYKDINMNFMDKDGFVFELQFNTYEGIKAKEGFEKKDGIWQKRNDGIRSSHFYYEQNRVIDPNTQDEELNERKRYLDYMTEKIWEEVPIPKNIERIKNMK